MCVRSVTSVYYRFYPHLFALYVIKIDETWTLKLRGTCQLLYDHILDKTRQILLCLLCLRSMIIIRINVRRFCPTVIGCYYWNDIPMSMREKPTRKLLKCSFYVLFLSVFINVFLWPCNISMYVVKSVIPIPFLRYKLLLFYFMKKCYFA